MTRHFGDDRDWFGEARFGLFVHWGIYAIPGWHEQTQYRRGLTREEYEPLATQFNPVKFCPDEWLDLAESAGMRYITFTTKHIDGFCMWDSGLTEYKVTNTPYARDTLAMLADACHRRSFPLCLYHSFVDHHHPNYPNQGRAHELPGPPAGDEPDVGKYADYVRAQVRELCTNYGEIHGIWWDANRLEVEDPSLNEMVRSLQPQAVINCRGLSEGDFDVFERDYRGEANEILAFDGPTEACQAVGKQSWGYREDEDYYTDHYLIHSIDRMMAKGANYLLNLGPMPDGTIVPEEQRILRRIGEWYGAVREAFDGTEPVVRWTDNRDVLTTRCGNTVYVHVLDPTGHDVVLHPICRSPARTTLLNDGRPLETRLDSLPVYHRDEGPCLRIRNAPVDEFAGEVMVIKLEFPEDVSRAGEGQIGDLPATAR
ncbi:MAG: glycoside hydrolase [Lentisphaerae bacterium]|jgi:alpha-L-fucosidase|nr:glycoside hydrolase [Lentisphaerota bacterium]MBT4814484.1 glycoside hydrolase [Lentisphaerota bacterium]MBT5607305.1 glycoside hydrolase [Lentisphaerota bacterium]MBT7055377.1 glycoside hydrolase [Lentisphaerota bacterium]MBT7840975.1 glycoside hydrolase [Lentisphaerota bacterium]